MATAGKKNKVLHRERRHVPYNLRGHQAKLCEALDSSPDDVGLHSLAVGLYSEGIIDGRTKRAILRHPGYRGADMLIDSVDLQVQRDPKIGESVLNIMSHQDCLRDIVQEIPSTSSCSSDDQNDDMENSSVSSYDSRTHKTEEEVFQDAESLNSKFETLLDNLLGFLKHVDVDRIQLKLSLLLNKEIIEFPVPKEIQESFCQVDEMRSHVGVIGYLVRKKFLGYLNHRLLEAFTKIINNEEWNILLKEYEAARDDFLTSTDLKTLAQVFRDHPSLAPKAPPGLPVFTVHLDSSWDDSDCYRWNKLLEKLVNWPPFIYIKAITNNCIIIEYGVLPFFAPAVVRDLTDPEIRSIIEEQGVIKIDLSEQLRQDASSGVQHQEQVDRQFLLVVSELQEESVEKQISIPSEKEDQSTVTKLVQKSLSADQKQISIPSDQVDRSITNLSTTATEHTHSDEEGLEPSDIKEKNTSLLEAVKRGADTATVSTLLKEGADIHTTDKYGNTPIHHAAQKGKKETVELLLNEGAAKYINTKNRFGEAPLHCAAQHGHDSIMEILIQYGATVDEKDTRGFTLIHWAAIRGKKTTVELLLKYKANYSIQSDYGHTMLHSAAYGGNTEIVELFLKLCGTSDLHKVGYSGYTPLHCAVSRGRIESVELLLKSGANVDGMKECHLTPLHVAADKNCVDIAEVLLKAGANVHLKDKVDRTPLHHAAREGHERIVELLLKYGANINEKDKSGFTPLHLTVGAIAQYETRLHSPFSSHEATVRILLSNGAKVNEQDHDGHTPLFYAKIKGRREIVQMLSNPTEPKKLDITSSSSIHEKVTSVKDNGSPKKMVDIVSKLMSDNPSELALNLNNARYFVIKSYTEDNVHRSIKYNVWCSTEHGNRRLDTAFKEQKAKGGSVYLFFSVNGSGYFCGVAKMMSEVDLSNETGIWTQDKWKGKFNIKWVYIKDVPNGQLRHIRLENNENKPVTNSRDTQEVPVDKGKLVMKVIHSYSHTTSIFDDFEHYEKRQEEETIIDTETTAVTSSATSNRMNPWMKRTQSVHIPSPLMHEEVTTHSHHYVPNIPEIPQRQSPSSVSLIHEKVTYSHLKPILPLPSKIWASLKQTVTQPSLIHEKVTHSHVPKLIEETTRLQPATNTSSEQMMTTSGQMTQDKEDDVN